MVEKAGAPPRRAGEAGLLGLTRAAFRTGGGQFSWRMINATQNEEGGKALGRFYLYNRILEKDRFLVWIKP